jgi:hypothetical protein
METALINQVWYLITKDIFAALFTLAGLIIYDEDAPRHGFLSGCFEKCFCLASSIFGYSCL